VAAGPYARFQPLAGRRWPQPLADIPTRVAFVFARPASSRSQPMIEYIITGVIALGVGVYLMIALLRPDKF